MNRPSYFKDYFTETSHNHENERLSYTADLEKYCDELESKFKGLIGDYEAQGDILYETKQELEKYKKALDKTCELLEISMSKIPIKYIPEGVDVFSHRYKLKDGLSEAFGTKVLSNSLKDKEDWKEWSLKDE